MTNIFNSDLENTRRLTILLDSFDAPQSLDMLYITDFMAVYGKDFKVSRNNLNGNNIYKYSILASRRAAVKEAMDSLISNGYAASEPLSKGFVYRITIEGKKYSGSLSSQYAEEYRKTAQVLTRKLGSVDEIKLAEYIYSLSVKDGKKGVFKWEDLT